MYTRIEIRSECTRMRCANAMHTRENAIPRFAVNDRWLFARVAHRSGDLWGYTVYYPWILEQSRSLVKIYATLTADPKYIPRIIDD